MGSDEQAKGTVIVKNMAAKTQEDVNAGARICSENSKTILLRGSADGDDFMLSDIHEA